ncbi:MAG TPA: fibro-slime domain-containing protein [Kofleriaceae bacterium]
MGAQSHAAVIGIAFLLVACGPKSSTDGDGDGGLSGADAGSSSSSDAIHSPDCQALVATIRDFTPVTHVDFEPPTDSDLAYPGLVRDMLGGDGKPVYAPSGSTPHTAGPAQFALWYRDTPGINQPFTVSLALTESSPGRYTYDSSAFFPIDGMGYGNSGIANDGMMHNFHFTTEIHTSFQYRGGEVFNFLGDDDLWLFINGRLAIDLGGLHPALPGSVNLDQMATALGIQTGNMYSMDIFHAERHTDASNFHVETTIDCFIIL